MKAVKKRELIKFLKSEGCAMVPSTGGGDHEKWRCPCGSHTGVVARHIVVSPGSLRNLFRDQLSCLSYGG